MFYGNSAVLWEYYSHSNAQIGVLGAEVGLDAVRGDVHPRQFPGGGLFLIGFSHDVTAQVCALNPVASIPGCVLHPSGVELRSMLNFHNEYALKPNHGPVDNSRSKPIETGFSLRKKITALAIKLPAPRFARNLFVNPFKAS